MKKELRGMQGMEFRADGDEGIFSGYITVWGTVDSYNSTFVKGSFKKTIQERGNRIKVLDDHGKIIGLVNEIREDDHGVFVQGALTMAVERARDVFEHMRAGAIDTLSFGFKTLADKWVQGVRNITEVKLYEVSPVTFEANEAAMIENIRAEKDGKEEERATDFNETVAVQDTNRKGWTLICALERTLDDIWWESVDSAEVREKMDAALADFHAAYLTWVNEYLALYWDESEERSKPGTTELRTSFASFAAGRPLEAIAAESDFTVSELRTLEKGKILSPAINHKIATLPEDVRSAYRAERATFVEGLCTELRSGGFSAAEGQRFAALLNEQREENVIVEKAEPVNLLSAVTSTLAQIKL